MTAHSSHHTIADAALEYAARGWHVFPVPPGARQSYKSAAHSDGRRWGATTDPDEIRRDFARWPNANVGIVCGPKSGLLVIDIDVPGDGRDKDGAASWAALVAAHGDIPHTIEANSASGGRHIYFRAPVGETIRNSVSQIAPGIDVRAEGGMVLGVPSVRPNGGVYSWRNPPGFFDLADCPEWLLARCRKPEPKAGFRIDTGTDDGAEAWARRALELEVAAVLSAPVGTRNARLNQAAFSLGQIVARGDLGEAHVIETLTRAGLAAGLDPAEIEGTIASGLKAGMAQPRGPKERERAAPGGDGAASEPPRSSRFLDVGELHGRPVEPRSWLGEGWIPDRTVTLFNGDGGTGKSYCAMQLGVAVAADRPWLGIPVKAGPAVYLSAEDDMDELHRRLAAITAAEGIGLGALSGRLFVRSLAGEDALLATLAPKTGVLVPTPLFAEVEAEVAERKPALVVADTLADLHPANENDRASARQFIGMLRGLAIRQSCAVVVLAHPSLTGINSGTGASGSTGWSNSVRSRLYLERIVADGYEPDPDRRRLRVMKTNYGRTGTEIGLTWRDGVFVADAQETGLDRMAATAKAERVFLKLLRAFAEQGRRVNAVGGQTYAPNVFAEHPDAEGVTKRAFRAAMEGFLRSGKLVIREEGPPSKRRQFLDFGGAE